MRSRSLLEGEAHGLGPALDLGRVLCCADPTIMACGCGGGFAGRFVPAQAVMGPGQLTTDLSQSVGGRRVIRVGRSQLDASLGGLFA